MPARYCQDSPDAILSCALEDMALFYHRPSGQTHMVISPVPEILEALGEGASMSAREVHARLAREYDLGPEADAIAQIEAHLDDLAALGLVHGQ